MTNPTRDETLSAHDALDALCGRIPEDTHTGALRRRILRALPPKPALTMAEIAWDDDKHYLAEAEQNLYGNVIMLGVDDDNMNMIAFLVPPEFGTGIDAAFRETLTPTGKRYTLTETTND